MDHITRYYMRKANMANKDEFHDHIGYRDIDTLRHATLAIIVAPIGTFCLVHALKVIHE